MKTNSVIQTILRYILVYLQIINTLSTLISDNKDKTNSIYSQFSNVNNTEM